MNAVPDRLIGMLRYAITDRSFRAENGKRWAQAGVDFVQLRDKSLDAAHLLSLAKSILEAIIDSGSQTKLLINGRADIALAAGAAGVHLTAHPEELRPQQVRKIFDHAGRANPIISVSCHSIAEVTRARDNSADLILFSPVFEKAVNGAVISEGLGLDQLCAACAAAAPATVLALGGVTEHNIAACLAAGAKGVAGIRLFA